MVHSSQVDACVVCGLRRRCGAALGTVAMLFLVADLVCRLGMGAPSAFADWRQPGAVAQTAFGRLSSGRQTSVLPGRLWLWAWHVLEDPAPPPDPTHELRLLAVFGVRSQRSPLVDAGSSYLREACAAVYLGHLVAMARKAATSSNRPKAKAKSGAQASREKPKKADSALELVEQEERIAGQRPPGKRLRRRNGRDRSQMSARQFCRVGCGADRLLHGRRQVLARTVGILPPPLEQRRPGGAEARQALLRRLAAAFLARQHAE